MIIGVFTILWMCLDEPKSLPKDGKYIAWTNGIVNRKVSRTGEFGGNSQKHGFDLATTGT